MDFSFAKSVRFWKLFFVGMTAGLNIPLPGNPWLQGLAVAVGPITGGALLNGFWWGSIFLAMVPVALIAMLFVALLVPTSRDPSVAPLDKPGLLLSIVGLGALVFTIIEAPGHGWMSARTLGGFGFAASVLVVFVVVERRTVHPMLDVSLFNNLRFSAASGAVAIAFFSLFGFMFLTTQYFQFAKGYSALSTGVRMLPVAIAVGVMAIVGTQLAVTLGNRLVISTGLGIMTVGFLWFSADTSTTSYLVIAAQMVVTGIGIGLTSSPATEAIMDVVPAHQAGVGSAVNDATREIGGTLGVAVMGSLFMSLYASSIDGLVTGGAVTDAVRGVARGSLGAAQEVVAQLSNAGHAAGARPILDAANDGFVAGFSACSLLAAGVTLVGCVAAAILLPGPLHRGADEPELDLAGAERAEARAATHHARALDDLLPTRY